MSEEIKYLIMKYLPFYIAILKALSYLNQWFKIVKYAYLANNIL